MIQSINKSKISFFEKINETEKPLTRLIKKKGKNQTNKIRNERGEVTTDTKDKQRIVRKHYEQLYANKLDQMDEMNKSSETYNFPE